MFGLIYSAQNDEHWLKCQASLSY